MILQDLSNRLIMTYSEGVSPEQKDDASRIVEWNLQGNSLHLKILSGRRGRAHDALLRIKKPLTNILGPKYHIGVRKITVKNYEIEIPSQKMVDVNQMPYVEDSTFQDGQMLSNFRN